MRLHHALDCTPNLPRLPDNRASGSGEISESMQDGAWGWWWEKQTALAQHGFSTAGPVTILGTCQGRHWFEKGRRTEAQRTLALRRRLSKHCRAGAGRFGTARGWAREEPPWRAVSKFLSSGKSAHSRGLPAAFTGLFRFSFASEPTPPYLHPLTYCDRPKYAFSRVLVTVSFTARGLPLARQTSRREGRDLGIKGESQGARDLLRIAWITLSLATVFR